MPTSQAELQFALRRIRQQVHYREDVAALDLVEHFINDIFERRELMKNARKELEAKRKARRGLR